MTNSKPQIVITADTSQARDELDGLKRASKDMADGMKRDGETAKKQFEGLTDPIKNSVPEVEKADSRIIASIQRRTAAIQAAGKGELAYQEQLLKNRGQNVDLYKPYLDQLKQAEAAQKAAAGSLDSMGMSAKQTTAALRQVPMQFTDIVVSLQGGQKPMQVLLQQGGQLKDVFGGVGAASKAMGNYVLGLINPFTLAAAGAAALAYGYYKGAQEAQEFNKTLILTGNSAGVTAGQLSQMAAAVGSLGGATRGRAAEVLNQLAGAGNIGAANMQRFTAAALELERVGGPAADATTKAFLELGKAPLQASVKLNEAQNYLTSSTYEQIKALEDQGRFTDAARVAQEAYSAAVEQRTPEIIKNLGLIERGWLAVATESKRAIDFMFDIGRAKTDVEKLAELQQTLAERQRNSLAQYGNSDADPAVGSLQKQIELLSRRVMLTMDAAAAEGQFKESIRAALGLSQEAVKYDSDLEKQRKGIAAATEKYHVALAAGNLTAKERNKIEEDYLKTVNGILAAKSAPNAKADNSLQREAEQQARLFADLAGLSHDFQKEWDLLNKAFSQGKINLDQLAESQGKLIAKQPFAREQAKELAEANKQAAKAYEEVAKSYERHIEQLQKSADGAGDHVQKLKDDESAALLAAAGNISLAQAIQQVIIARLQEQQAAEAKAGNQEAVDAIEKEIRARRELSGLIGDKEARDAAKKAADQAAAEWQKASDKIEGSITDALMRGFESGKGFAENLRDTVQNMFKTMVLRPVISAVINPVAGAIAGSLGASSAANAAGALGGIGVAGSLFGAGGLAGSILGGAGWLTGATTLSGSLAAAGSLIGTGTAGGVMSGIGMGIGALGPIALGVGALLSLAKSVDHSGTPHTGGSAEFSAYRGLSLGGGVYGVGSSAGAYSTQTEEFASGVAKSIVSILDSTASAFGQQIGYAAAAGFADDSSKDGAWGALSIKLGEQIIAGFGQDGNGKWPGRGFSDGQAGTQEYLAAVSADVRNALEQIGLPDWAQHMLDQLGAAPALDDLAKTVEQINATQTALAHLGAAMPQLQGLSGDAVNGLLATFGGIENLAKSAGSYYDNFYNQAERSAETTRQITEAMGSLGMAMPATREAFRSLVEAQDLTTDAGQKTYAALLKLSPAFASVVAETQALTDSAAEAAAAMAKAAEQMAEAGRRALASLAEDQGSLMVELLTAQGSTEEARALARANALARITDGLSATDSAAATAAYDYNLALRDQIASLLAATDAQKQAEVAAKQAADEAIARAQARAQAIAAEGYGLTTRLLQSQGDTAELRRRELEALDPTNRAILEQIYALEDQKAAAEAAAKAAAEASADQQRAAADQQRAADEAARAAERIRDAWQSVADSLYEEVARIRGLIQQDSGASYASLLARFGITTAQARAGDQEAAKLLPSLSQTMLTLAEAQATSLVELQRIRAQTAASLEGTGNILASRFGLTIPKLDTGTNYVPRDMLAVVHKGEAVVPAAYNPASGGGSSAELVAEVRGLRDDNKVQALRIVQLSAELNKLVKNWDANGMPSTRIEV